MIDDSSYFRLEIQGKERNKDLWQKEALWNVGAKFVKNAKILFFIDGDILPRSPVWASEIIRRIESNKNQIIQCFSHFQDSLPGSPMIPSWMSEYYFNHKTPNVAPGLAWAMSREAYLGLGGINAIFPEGSADTAFLYELFRIKKGMPDWFLNSLRPIDHSYKITFHNAVLTHINHGKDRNYNNRSKIVDFNRMNLSSIVHIDQQGLLSWNSTNPLIRNVFSIERKLEILSTADGLQLLKDLKSAGLIHIPKHSNYQTKTALEYIRTKQNDFAIITEHDDELNEIKCYSFNKGLRSAELMAQNVLADGEDNIIDIEIFFPKKINIEFKIVEYGGDYRLIKHSKKFSDRFIYRENISHRADQVNYLQLIFRFQFEGHCSVKYRIKIERR